MAKQNIRYSDQAYYDVTVEGEIAQSVIEILANYYSGNVVCKYQNHITHVKGIVKDQVALSGLLVYLCDLHYILLSVNMKNLLKPNRHKNGKISSIS